MNRTLTGAVLVLGLLAALPAVADGQDRPQEMTLDLLSAPASPAFVVLDVAPEAVERPGSVTDFAFSLQNASNDFSTLPANYAAAFAPYWVFGGRNLKYDDYAAGRGPLLRTAAVSFGTTAEDDSLGNRVRSLGVGLRMTIVQGAIDEEFAGYRETLDSLYDDLAELSEAVAEQIPARLAADPLHASLEAQIATLNDQRDALSRAGVGDDDPQIVALDRQIDVAEKLREARLGELHAEIENDLRAAKAGQIADMQQRARDLRVRRLGFNLDLAAGAAWTFPDQEWDSGELRKAGAWLTAAYEGRDLSGLAVGRYVRDDLRRIDHWDVGLRLLTTRGRFSFSGEALHRSSSDEDLVEASWRYDLVVDYQYATNQKVGLTFGKDFDGSPEGNVLAILNLVFGFGAERPMFE